jgi:sulfatase modifying factor 1
MLSNYWQGLFPFANQMLDGWECTSPVRTYLPNGYGLYDMIGNVWEWTNDWYSFSREQKPTVKDCCALPDPRGGRERDSYDPAMPKMKTGRKVAKGGSHLCAENYCRRYRPAARIAQAVDSTASHMGFRCVLRPQL